MFMKLMRRFGDLGISGRTARWYDKNSREHRLQEMRGYAAEASRYIKQGASVLEIAPGPGYLAIALAGMGNYRVTGVDISHDFVAIARKNAAEAGVTVDFVQGNVACLPFDSGRFDFFICTAAFKNFKEPLKALEEMHRVLRPGGAGVIIDMNRAVSNKTLVEHIQQSGLKGFQAFMMGITFKYFLKKGAYTKAELERLLSETNFGEFEVKEEGIGLHIFMRK